MTSARIGPDLPRSPNRTCWTIIEQRLRDKERSGELQAPEQDGPGRGIDDREATPRRSPGLRFDRDGRAPSTSTRASRSTATSSTSPGRRAVCRPARARTRSTWCRCPSTCCSSTRRDRRQVAQARRADRALPGPRQADPGRRLLPRPDEGLAACRVYYDQQGTLIAPAWASRRSRPSSRRRARGCASTRWSRCDEAALQHARARLSLLCRRAFSRAGRRPPPAPGSFPNPITDICWSCILPLSHRRRHASATSAARRTSATRARPVCSCGVNPTVGLSIGFWEPARHVEVVRKPFCLAIARRRRTSTPASAAPSSRAFTRPEGDGDGGSFYQAHFYVNPVLYWLEVVTDFPCLERGRSISPT
ncbi:MAG: TraU family protein [Comamonadaceae bacterium]|nr:TraU family protein [Comamonadaceae bacterium]